MSESVLSWSALIIAGLFEVVWAIFLKNSKGFSELTPTILFIVTLFISMFLLAYSMRTIPMGIAYPVWTGIGAVGTVFVGIMFFKEDQSFQKIIFLSVILIGIIGLKLTSKH
ncbi:MAG: multidrug efflux SMR transporter [Rhizobacter sp.]|nr:multidrug efflux SMR transporter [Bacteriovorax sp.]